MKLKNFLIIALLTMPTMVLSQGKNSLSFMHLDNKMQHLTNLVMSLRGANKQQWEKITESFKNDNTWTLMDEIIPDREHECLPTDRTIQRFSLNRILSQQMGYEKNKVLGEFNNGEDPHFNYSLIERSVKSGKTVSYELKSREGKQIFVIVPYEKDAKMEAEITLSGKSTKKVKQQEDGNIYLTTPDNLKISPKDVLKIHITNIGKKNMAFVLMNHNTRKL